MFETSVRAKSWERRRNAGESSSKKLDRSCESSYCSRNRYAGFWYSTLPLRSVSETLTLTTTSHAGSTPGRRVIGERRSRGGKHGAAQSGVGGFTGIVEDAVVSAGGKLAHDGGRQHLLDAVGKRLVLEGGDGDGLDVLGKLHCVARGVVAASRQQERQQQRRAGTPHESSLDFSCGARGRHALGTFHRGQGRDAEIVGGSPQPDAVGLRGIGLDR